MSSRRVFQAAAIVAILSCGTPAAAQLGQSDGYKFLQAVKDAKGDEVNDFLKAPGTTIVNTRDYATRETALHIVARRDDATYTVFLLQHGAEPNLRDKDGNTPLMVAATAGAGDLIPLLLRFKANVNLANDAGETPLIRAVQRRDLQMVRDLLAVGADADQADSLAGKSARAYAEEDSRTPALAKLFADVPKRDRRAVAGPKL